MPFRYSERKGHASVYDPKSGTFERKPLQDLHSDETDDKLLNIWLDWLPKAVTLASRRNGEGVRRNK